MIEVRAQGSGTMSVYLSRKPLLFLILGCLSWPWTGVCLTSGLFFSSCVGEAKRKNKIISMFMLKIWCCSAEGSVSWEKITWGSMVAELTFISICHRFGLLTRKSLILVLNRREDARKALIFIDIILFDIKLFHTLALIYQINMHQNNASIHIFMHRSAFINLDLSLGCDQISHQVSLCIYASLKSAWWCRLCRRWQTYLSSASDISYTCILMSCIIRKRRKLIYRQAVARIR